MITIPYKYYYHYYDHHYALLSAPCWSLGVKNKTNNITVLYWTHGQEIENIVPTLTLAFLEPGFLTYKIVGFD